MYLPCNQQGVQQLEGIRSELERLKGLDKERQFGRLELSLSNVKEEDWANNWKAYFKPFPVGSRLAVKPTWEQYDNPEGRLVLEIDPSSSFGTGQHHTTQLCGVVGGVRHPWLRHAGTWGAAAAFWALARCCWGPAM